MKMRFLYCLVFAGVIFSSASSPQIKIIRDFNSLNPYKKEIIENSNFKSEEYSVSKMKRAEGFYIKSAAAFSTDPARDTLIYNYVYNHNYYLSGYLCYKLEDSSLTNFESSLYDYDAADNLLSKIIQLWTDTMWNNYAKDEYEYYTEGERKTWTFYRWASEQWKGNERYSYDYNEEGKLNERVYWSFTDSTWTPNYKTIYEYDSLGRNLRDISQNYSNGEWKNSSVGEYEYDSIGRKDSENWSVWRDSVWEPNWSRFYIYDSTDRIFQIIIYYWPPESGTDIRITYYYNNAGLIDSALNEKRQDTIWLNNYRTIYTYDEKDNKILELDEIWKSGAWENYCRDMYEYDENENITLFHMQIWNDGAWSHINGGIFVQDGPNFYPYNGYKLEFGYERKVGIDKNENGISSFYLSQNYPNPFNPTTKINFNLSSPSNIELIIFDALGRKITALAKGHYAAGEYSVNFDGSKLASGVYLYALRVDNAITARKMLLLK